MGDDDWHDLDKGRVSDRMSSIIWEMRGKRE